MIIWCLILYMYSIYIGFWGEPTHECVLTLTTQGDPLCLRAGWWQNMRGRCKLATRQNHQQSKKRRCFAPSSIGCHDRNLPRSNCMILLLVSSNITPSWWFVVFPWEMPVPVMVLWESLFFLASCWNKVKCITVLSLAYSCLSHFLPSLFIIVCFHYFIFYSCPAFGLGLWSYLSQCNFSMIHIV